MNPLQQAIKNGLYPKRMVVSENQVREIVKDFYTRWEPYDESNQLLKQYAHCTAYYMTRRGGQKKCVVIWDTRI